LDPGTTGATLTAGAVIASSAPAADVTFPAAAVPAFTAAQLTMEEHAAGPSLVAEPGFTAEQCPRHEAAL